MSEGAKLGNRNRHWPYASPDPSCPCGRQSAPEQRMGRNGIFQTTTPFRVVPAWHCTVPNNEQEATCLILHPLHLLPTLGVIRRLSKEL